MEEIKVGEYVRTNDGMIEAVEENLGYRSFLYHCVCYKTDKENALEERAIVKHSPSIIDLIEVGDYVNGYKIIKILIDPFINEKQLFTNQYESNWQGDKALITFHEIDIKTILTKEQYEANCYEVK